MAKRINNNLTYVPCQWRWYSYIHPHIIAYLNCKASWKRLTLLNFLQKQKKMLNHARQELTKKKVNTKKFRKNKKLPCLH
jgi:hypothetical protein